jgi:hypothetical protein
MKKIKSTLVLLMALSLLTATAQVKPMYVKAPGSMNRDAEYGCLPNSLFSQLPSPFLGVWFGDNAYDFSVIADDFTVSGPFTTMRFWGNNYLGCPPGNTQAFTIKFYERNAGDPTIPGPEVNSFNLTVIPQPINFLFDSDYQVDVIFPSQVNLLDGWVSISRFNPGDGCFFGWYGNNTGNSASFYNVDQTWLPSEGMLAFCLGGEGVPETPVSNWALIIGVVLIGTFVIFRFRRLI